MNSNHNVEIEIKRVRKALPKIITLKNSQNLRAAGGMLVAPVAGNNLNQTSLTLGGLMCFPS